MIEKILERLDGVKTVGQSHIAKCPAHDDKTPSLKLTELRDGRILLHCFAGCAPHEILTAIGLAMGDLFPDSGLGHYRGFQQIEETQTARQNDKHKRDDIILALAQSQRDNGERLTPKDLDTEKQAFLRIRLRKTHATA